jgi:predicted PurR-regulated permease PerM
MLSNIAVCPLASFILTLVIIINILGIYLVGFQFAIIVTNVLISIFFVWLANKTCDRYQWVSWLITAYFIICLIGAVALIIMPSETREGFVEGAKSKKSKKSKDSKESKESKNKDEDEDEDKDE